MIIYRLPVIKNLVLTLLLVAFATKGYSYTIEEKRKDLIEHDGGSQLLSEKEQNEQIKALNIALQEEYQKAAALLSTSSDPTAFEEEYGSCESLYVIPPEVASLKLSLHCLLSIPKESWPKMIELILTHNNIGIKKLSPFVKQLFLLKDDYMNVEVITSDEKYLSLLDGTKRVVYVYTPPIENIKSSFYFLDKFKNIKTTFVYQVGAKVAIVGLAKDVSKLVALAANVWDEKDQRVSKILSPQKISSEDAVLLLKSFFGGLTDYSRTMISMKGGNGLSAFPLKKENSLVLIGSKKIVEQAESLLRETESQVTDPSEVTLFWHTCNHCKPIELAETLSKVYSSLTSCTLESAKKRISKKNVSSYPPQHATYNDGPSSYPEGLPPAPKDKNTKGKSEHFFPFPATGSLLMVVRKDTLNKIKEIIKKLDTPKKMVEIEVLLCERRVDNTSKSGINLLKLAGAASDTHGQNITYGGEKDKTGIMQFLFNRKADQTRNIPAIDLSYSFLLSQEDVMVTASPSTTTLNQIPTTLSITDQISIHNGANEKNVSSYAREDFGITITLTPTVHENSNDEHDSLTYITLENDIQFDTITNINNERPAVHKRHITNTVRIPDGETVIIGGLRASSTEEMDIKIPFLGEIPGFAKIFGNNVSTQKNSEMFIFIKPRVIKDAATDLLRIREDKLKKRPGDTEMLLQKINESRRYEDQVRFQKSVNLLFGSGNRHEQTL